MVHAYEAAPAAGRPHRSLPPTVSVCAPSARLDHDGAAEQALAVAPSSEQVKAAWGSELDSAKAPRRSSVRAGGAPAIATVAGSAAGAAAACSASSTPVRTRS